jgi:hypothetical protein
MAGEEVILKITLRQILMLLRKIKRKTKTLRKRWVLRQDPVVTVLFVVNWSLSRLSKKKDMNGANIALLEKVVRFIKTDLWIAKDLNVFGTQD